MIFTFRRRVREIAHAAESKAVLQHEQKPEHDRRQQRYRMQHERRAYGAIVRHGIERRQADLYRGFESANAPWCWNGHTDDEQRNQEKRAGKRHVDAERPCHRPDTEPDRQP